MEKTSIVQINKEQIIAKIGCKRIYIKFSGNKSEMLRSLVYDINHHMENYFSLDIKQASFKLMHISSHIELIERRTKSLSIQKCIIELEHF